MTENISASSAKGPKGRLLALDILRGITIAGMLLVNNPGSWNNVYAPLRHAEWSGLTPTDLVFPFFMFIMGISTYMSLRKYDFRFSWHSFAKILRRTCVIFLIGLAITWFGLFLRGILSEKTFVEAALNFNHIRILGVLPRLALCYGVGATIALLMPRKSLPWLVVAILAIYAVMLIFGNGYEESENNIISRIDRAVLGPEHMYQAHFDPEGLLSTLPSIAHMLIGFICGGLIMKTKDNDQRIISLFIVGAILTFAGFLLDYGLPINKKVWSPTFVLTTCGLASTLLALLIWIIDIKGHKAWCRFFEVFGINPLFLYCLGSVLAILIGAICVPVSGIDGMISIKDLIFDYGIMPICGGNATFASLVFALLFVIFNWAIGLILYKKKIYIKI